MIEGSTDFCITVIPSNTQHPNLQKTFLVKAFLNTENIGLFFFFFSVFMVNFFLFNTNKAEANVVTNMSCENLSSNPWN